MYTESIYPFGGHNLLLPLIYLMRFNVPPWLAHVFKRALPLITFTNSFAQSLSNETQAASIFVKQFALIFCFSIRSGSTTCHDTIISHILKGSCMLITTPMYKPASCSAKLLGHYFIQHQFVFVKHQTWEIVFVVCHLAYNNTEYSRLSCQITAPCGLSLSAPLEGIRMKQELDRYSC